MKPRVPRKLKKVVFGEVWNHTHYPRRTERTIRFASRYHRFMWKALTAPVVVTFNGETLVLTQAPLSQSDGA
jgi:hypothetical protein